MSRKETEAISSSFGAFVDCDDIHRNTRRKQIWGKKVSLVGDILTLIYLQDKYLVFSQ